MFSCECKPCSCDSWEEEIWPELHKSSNYTWFQIVDLECTKLHLEYLCGPFLNRQLYAQSKFALVTSQLDYCNVPYMGPLLKSPQKLQLDTSQSTLITPLLWKVHWLWLVFTHQTDYIVPSHNIISLHGKNQCIPLFRDCHLQGPRKFAFFFF